MSVRNRFIKFWGYLSVYLLAVIQAYLIALLCTGTLASFVCFIWSFIRPLPAYIGAHYGVLMLQGAIPVSVVFLIYILRNAKKQEVARPQQQEQH